MYYNCDRWVLDVIRVLENIGQPSAHCLEASEIVDIETVNADSGIKGLKTRDLIDHSLIGLPVHYCRNY